MDQSDAAGMTGAGGRDPLTRIGFFTIRRQENAPRIETPEQMTKGSWNECVRSRSQPVMTGAKEAQPKLPKF
jgi:hypothetical protein